MHEAFGLADKRDFVNRPSFYFLPEPSLSSPVLRKYNRGYRRFRASISKSINPQTQKIEGLDIDIMNAIAARENFNMEYKNVPFGRL